MKWDWKGVTDRAKSSNHNVKRIPKHDHIRKWDNPRGSGILSNYGGPGGAGRTLHKTDEAFKKHDEAYGTDISKYLSHSDADLDLRADLNDRLFKGGPREIASNLGAQAWFQTKKYLPLPHAGTKRKDHNGIEPQAKKPKRHQGHMPHLRGAGQY